MTIWQTTEEFSSSVNVDEFLNAIQFTSGVIIRPDESLFENEHSEVDEEQYAHQAWRWQGVHDETVFYLDIAANDVRHVRPFTFFLYYNDPGPVSWHMTKRMKPVLDLLGEIRIDHVTSRVKDSQVNMFREVPSGTSDFHALVIYRANDEEEVLRFGEFLTREFSDSGLYIGHRMT